eukprot:807489-Pleurochrysis_carterae.AAC.1
MNESVARYVTSPSDSSASGFHAFCTPARTAQTTETCDDPHKVLGGGEGTSYQNMRRARTRMIDGPREEFRSGASKSWTD